MEIMHLLMFFMFKFTYLLELTEQKQHFLKLTDKSNVPNDIIPCTRVATEKYKLQIDCSNRLLTYIRSSWFPEDTTELMLQSNQLTVIPNNILNHLYKLERLSLQDNVLTTIESKAFQGLNNLHYLNLENNYIDLFSLPVDLFSNLVRLMELRLRQNSENLNHLKIKSNSINNGSFPSQMFGNLRNLQIFTVTISSKMLYFNSEFSNLTSLSYLELYGNINFIEQNSFQNVQFVQSLLLSNLKTLHNFNDLALGAFQHVKWIKFEVIEMGLHKVLQAMRPLVNTDMERIELFDVRVGPQASNSILTGNAILYENSTEYLKLICVQEIRLKKNDIFVVLSNALNSPTLTRCLKRLYLIERNLVGNLPALSSVLLLGNLQLLVLSSVDETVELKSQRYLRDTKESRIRSIKSVTSINLPLNEHRNASQKLTNTFSLNRNFTTVKKTSINISPSLRELYISSLFHGVWLDQEFKIKGAENLLSLYFINNDIKSALYPLQGLTNIQKLVFSQSDFSILSQVFFDTYPTLRILQLDSCKLSSSFMAQNSFRLFKNLSNLQELDLSYNFLDVLSANTFLNNPNLQTLNLASNRFRKIPFDLKLTPNLKYLDLRENVITSIYKSERDTMERNIESLGSFRLLLSGNILSCGCDNLPFLQWLQLTNVQLDENKNFTCINSQGVLSSTLAFGHIDGLWRECWGQFYFNVAIVLLCFIFIGFLVSILWMKNKTLIISGILQAFTDFKLKKCSDYRFGVFIGYSDQDYHFACNPLREYIEESLKLTTFVIDRDLSPSIAMADGIVEAINSSWRILIVVNEMFIQQNEWFLFTIRSAVYAITPENPLRVVFLVEENCINQLPTEVLSSVPEDNVIVLNDWQMTYEFKQVLIDRLTI